MYGFGVVALRLAIILKGAAGVLVPRHQRSERRYGLVALVGVRHEAGIEVDRTDAAARLPDGFADLLGDCDAVPQPDRSDEVDLDARVVHRQVLRRHSGTVDVSRLPGGDAEGNAIEKARGAR